MLQDDICVKCGHRRDVHRPHHDGNARTIPGTVIPADPTRRQDACAVTNCRSQCVAFAENEAIHRAVKRAG